MRNPLNKVEFEAKLNEVYDGAVKPLNPYLNERAIICFHCTACGLKFFNKPIYMVGRESQRHVCSMPYGDSRGLRLGVVPKRGDSHGKGKKKYDNIDIDLLNKMVWEDYTYQQIAKEFQVKPLIIQDHFKAEGLIK